MPRWLTLRHHLWLAAGACGVFAVVPGCGSADEEMRCDESGCYVCDGYGCRPAEPGVGGSAGSPQQPDAGSPDVDAPCDPSETTCPCGADGACEGELECIDGLCLLPCTYSSQCGSGRICVNGKCEVGCDATVPCPDGYVCSANGTCEPDTTAPECSETEPCAGGLACVDGQCVGKCDDNADCAPGEICDGSTGTCLIDPQPKRPCEDDPGVCAETQTCVNGYCRYPCTDSDGCKLIDARIPVCEEGICMSELEANPECTAKEDCAPEEDCVSNVCM